MNKRKIIMIGIVGHGSVSPFMHELAMEKGVQLIDIKTVPKLGKTSMIDNYVKQL